MNDKLFRFPLPPLFLGCGNRLQILRQRHDAAGFSGRCNPVGAELAFHDVSSVESVNDDDLVRFLVDPVADNVEGPVGVKGII